jgi:hypothetical protein
MASCAAQLDMKTKPNRSGKSDVHPDPVIGSGEINFGAPRYQLACGRWHPQNRIGGYMDIYPTSMSAAPKIAPSL